MTGLRVIGGVARGRKLQSVSGDTTRPVTDQVKESFFNILGADIQGAALLDLFAGTGSIGIEALSRGASFVRFIDLNRQPIVTIRANLAHTRLEAGAEVVQSNAFRLLERPADRKFDYIYVAPPQYQSIWERAIQTVDQHPDWLSQDAWVIAQIHPVEYKALPLQRISEFDQRRYGSTLLVFYRFSEIVDPD